MSPDIRRERSVQTVMDINGKLVGHLDVWLFWARIPGTKVMMLIASEPYVEVKQ